eukprot:CAMPEP_0184683196 /NCGR_PEP_ID=MMETSP0312-20130426/10227_1 /TAXON_ID=31354 /ORGANISM="Compsopogon coeruleus, Strain SAG 36.94" /LENGTH=164 /DNA_ID=CAMNT_0027135325 /DNA_START=66 /DNA_END=561 /DNA_ORIENTATION=+
MNAIKYKKGSSAILRGGGSSNSGARWYLFLCLLEVFQILRRYDLSIGNPLAGFHEDGTWYTLAAPARPAEELLTNPSIPAGALREGPAVVVPPPNDQGSIRNRENDLHNIPGSASTTLARDKLLCVAAGGEHKTPIPSSRKAASQEVIAHHSKVTGTYVRHLVS